MSIMDIKDPKKRLTSPRRLINWWMTWEDLNWPNHDIHEKIKRRAEASARASVTTAVIFGAHFRWDYLPYFTLVHDYIGTVAEELHKYGIELYDRHSINLIHRYDTKEEMRHVMLHSGPHLPFSPSREAAASWEYNGKKLNDWRMIDVTTGKPLYYPQYASEGFCYNNPDFLEAYCLYAKQLIADTGIDGIASEDSVHYMHYLSCACPHCKGEFKRRTGLDLPGINDRSFWGNWASDAWREWIDMRYDTGKRFFENLTRALPSDFPMITCGSNSADYGAPGKSCDARVFTSGGSNYVHSEMCGNTPAYKNDPVTANTTIINKMVAFSHHQAIARENNIRSFSTGYGFTEASANIIWAVNKMQDTDCLFSTLKARLGLPDHMLRELPEEPEIISKSFAFEKEHPELFFGEALASVGVYFSSKTRDHSFFGNIQKGYYRDYADTLRELFSSGIGVHTVFEFPENTEKYSVIAVPSAVEMSDSEISAMKKYAARGGIVLVSGPSQIPECKNEWRLETCPKIDDPMDFFDSIAYGVWHKSAEWIVKTTVPESSEECSWREVYSGIFYNPHRISDGKITDSFIGLCRRFIKEMPVNILSAKGYLATMFETERGIALHLLAEDFDTDIDHKLDEMRFHRSRVNYVNKVEPIGVGEPIMLKAQGNIKVYTPFSDEPHKVNVSDGVYTVDLPKNTAYAIIQFQK